MDVLIILFIMTFTMDPTKGTASNFVQTSEKCDGDPGHFMVTV
jgi:hypothetical protein